jgi:hypothetical protein
MINDMLIMYLFTKSQGKSSAARTRELAKKDAFNAEFSRRVNEEAAKLRGRNASASTSSIKGSESFRDSRKQDHIRDSRKQDHIRMSGANG